MKKNNGLRWLFIAVCIFLLDIASKFWIIKHFYLYESIRILPFFSITYVHNIGAAFSSFAGFRWMLALVATVISLVIIYLLYRNSQSKRLENFSLSLILGGALGNLFDRIAHGYVIDFLDVNFGNWHYPTFNIADCTICIGVALFIYSGYKTKKVLDKTKEEKI